MDFKLNISYKTLYFAYVNETFSVPALFIHTTSSYSCAS